MLLWDDLSNLGLDMAPCALYGMVGTGTFLASIITFRLSDYFMDREENSDLKEAEETETDRDAQKPRAQFFYDLMEDMLFAILVTAVSLAFTWFISNSGMFYEDEGVDLEMPEVKMEVHSSVEADLLPLASDGSEDVIDNISPYM